MNNKMRQTNQKVVSVNDDYFMAKWSCLREGDKLCLRVVPSVSFRWGRPVIISLFGVFLISVVSIGKSGSVSPADWFAATESKSFIAVWVGLMLAMSLVIGCINYVWLRHVEHNLMKHGAVLECSPDEITIHPLYGVKSVVPRGGKIVIKRLISTKGEYTERWLYVYQTSTLEVGLARTEGGRCKFHTALEKFCAMSNISMEVVKVTDEPRPEGS